MSAEESQPKPPSRKEIDRFLAHIFDVEISSEEMASAPDLPAPVAKDQDETFAGTSDHALLVDQLAEKEEERDAFKKERDKLRFNLEEQKFNERYDLHELRRTYTPYLFYMTVGWLVFVALLVTASSIGWSHLTDAVLIALITTTTTNVIGMFLIAARWLFPSKGQK
jgi:hypothetical protein